MAPAAEPPLWEVDANLRPEGKDGPLVRTVESYMRYYKRWAENWEFQALLKPDRSLVPHIWGEKICARNRTVCVGISRSGFLCGICAGYARPRDR